MSYENVLTQSAPHDSPFMGMPTSMDAMDYLQYPPSPGAPAFSSGTDFDGLITGQMGDYMYTASPFSNTSPQPYMPSPDVSVSPRAMVGNISDSDRPSTRHSRGSGSPPAIPYAATVPRSVARHPHSADRFDPMTTVGRRNSATNRRVQKARRRRNSDESDDEDEDDEYHGSNSSGGPVETRRESVRQQRIESEQRRRDDLRRHYDQLRDVLPPQQVRLSKVSILAKATEHIKELEAKNRLEAGRVDTLTSEISRLRQVHDTLIARALPALHLQEY
ncbi:hypothetical protein CYLTODRAFT_452665 [Cylindrobasidium torrendii FP15055 ss-10]|uniref:BHLH domain-containing protein n=1 Tax=Cylindrobasidium torrendii FP15055 ss-10 TaxID=1314674 RepID=A0A0D7BGP9_9AGAR|nr:hypothetical protein CYLTODRAFT_452665 [Cylindrobasidium torrendii FP15055 ss-10]